MAKRIGIYCIILGFICLLSSAGFAVYNRVEAQKGAVSSQELLQVLQQTMAEANAPLRETVFPENLAEDASGEMLTVPAGDYESIGILSIPVLELELPVLTPWSYAKLKKAPCHYYGSCCGSDFVIAAHNYPTHFGRLSELQAGDLVLFTDARGEVHGYEVVLLETLSPTATLDMITSGFDLSLYTCTPGGSNRVTARCRAVNR